MTISTTTTSATTTTATTAHPSLRRASSEDATLNSSHHNSNNNNDKNNSRKPRSSSVPSILPHHLTTTTTTTTRAQEEEEEEETNKNQSSSTTTTITSSSSSSGGGGGDRMMILNGQHIYLHNFKDATIKTRITLFLLCLIPITLYSQAPLYRILCFYLLMLSIVTVNYILVGFMSFYNSSRSSSRSSSTNGLYMTMTAMKSYLVHFYSFIRRCVNFVWRQKRNLQPQQQQQRIQQQAATATATAPTDIYREFGKSWCFSAFIFVSYGLMGYESPLWILSLLYQHTGVICLELCTNNHLLTMSIMSINILSTGCSILWACYLSSSSSSSLPTASVNNNNNMLSLSSIIVIPMACLTGSMILTIRLCSFMKQITSFEKASEQQKSLIHSEQLYKKLYRDAPSLFITINKYGIIKNCNRTVLSLTGMKRDQILNDQFTIYSLLTPESQSMLRDLLIISSTTNTKQQDVTINNIELDMLVLNASSGKVMPIQQQQQQQQSSSIFSRNSWNASNSSSSSSSSSSGSSSASPLQSNVKHMLASITKTYQVVHHHHMSKSSNSNSSNSNNSNIELVYNIILQDISEKYMTQYQLQLAKEKAEEASKSKSIFLNTMSHEIRTPMTAIVALSELLLNDKSLSSEQSELVKSIMSSSVVLRTLISDILDLSKIEANKFRLDYQKFDLRESLETVDRVTRTSAREKNLDYTFVIQDNVPTQLIGDALRVNQILLNLTNNSIKFTHRGSVKVFVTSDMNQLSPYLQSQMISHWNKSNVNNNHHHQSHSPETTELEPEMIEAEENKKSSNNINNYNNNNRNNTVRLYFTVSDTGIGIPRKRMKDLFQPFSQLQEFDSKFTGGTGLGLCISKSLVQLMNGHICVDSEESVGSTFCFAAELEMVSSNYYNTRVNESSRCTTVAPCMKSQLLDYVLGCKSAELISTTTATAGTARRQVCDEEEVNILSPYGGQEEMHVGEDDQQQQQLEAQQRQDSNKADVYSAVVEPTLKTNDLSQLKILVTDDNAINQKVLAKILQALGVLPTNIKFASNGAIAVEVFKEYGAHYFDQVYMDLHMPVMSGFDATKLIRQMDKQVTIIALTANATDIARKQCETAGFSYYLSKPYTMNQIGELLLHKKR